LDTGRDLVSEWELVRKTDCCVPVRFQYTNQVSLKEKP